MMKNAFYRVISMQNRPVDMCSFFHTVLFAYQKSVKDILGTGEASLIHPILDNINMVVHKENPNLVDEESSGKILENLLENLLKNGAAKWVDIDEIEDGKYLFHVEDCRFSKHIHEFLNTKDTTCPFALAAMAFIQLATGKKVRPTESEYTKTGTKTIIEFLPQQQPKKKIALAHV
jgi:hypothetical protein